MRKSIFTIFLGFVFQFTAQSQAAFFDKSFGNNGFVETNFGIEGVGGISDMVLLPDGKLLVRYDQTKGPGISARNLRLARFLPDGALDTTFGSGGSVILHDSLAQNGGFDFGDYLVVHSGGKILTAFSSIFLRKTILMQFHADGEPDASFGTNGKFEIDEGTFGWGDPNPVCNGILKQSNGRIIVSYQSYGEVNDVGFRRVNANGTLPGGSEITWAYTYPAEEWAESIVLRPDDKIQVCGWVVDHDVSLSHDMLLATFDPFGYTDDSFGNMGFVRQDVTGNDDRGHDLQVLPDGKTLCVGSAVFDLFLAKFNPDGSPDTLFAPGGKRVYDNLLQISHGFDTRFSNMAADQTFVISAQPAIQKGAVFKFKANGDVDSTFNGGHPVVFPTNQYFPQKPIVLADRRILVCGYKDDAQDKFFIARLLPSVDAVPFYQDADGDGFGNANVVQFWVEPPAGFVNNSHDCDDQNQNVFPGAAEICNGLDDNCDGKTDDILILNCVPQIAIALNVNGLASLLPADVNATDPNSPCAAQPSSLQIDVLEFDCADLGQQTVTLSGVNISGISGQCQTLVNVADNLPPTAICQSQIEIEIDDTGLFTLNPILADAGSSDNCGIAEMSVFPAQFSSLNLGNNLVTLIVKDSSGNEAVCQTIATVSQVSGTGAAFLDNSLFEISPNPADETVTLKISESVDFQELNLEVLDVVGRVLFTEKRSDGRHLTKLDVQNLSPGEYFLRLELDGGFVYKKLIIN